MKFIFTLCTHCSFVELFLFSVFNYKDCTFQGHDPTELSDDWLLGANMAL